MPDSGINSSRVCLALSVALSGFLFTLLAVYSSRTLWNHFSGPSVHGFPSFRVFHPLKSRTPLGANCSLVLRTPRKRPSFAKAPGLQSFSPFKEPYPRTSHYTESGGRDSLGVRQLWGVHPFRPCSLARSSLFRIFTRFRRNERDALEFFCRKIDGAPKRPSTPLLFSASSAFPNCSVKRLLRVYLFHRMRVLALLQKQRQHP